MWGDKSSIHKDASQRLSGIMKLFRCYRRAYRTPSRYRASGHGGHADVWHTPFGSIRRTSDPFIQSLLGADVWFVVFSSEGNMSLTLEGLNPTVDQWKIHVFRVTSVYNYPSHVFILQFSSLQSASLLFADDMVVLASSDRNLQHSDERERILQRIVT